MYFGETLYIKAVINSIPNNELVQLKAFADNMYNVVKTILSIIYREENIVGKGENAGYQHILLFPQFFQKLSSSGSLKVGIGW